jgi:hypothetical protein
MNILDKDVDGISRGSAGGGKGVMVQPRKAPESKG